MRRLFSFSGMPARRDGINDATPPRSDARPEMRARLNRVQTIGCQVVIRAVLHTFKGTTKLVSQQKSKPYWHYFQRAKFPSLPPSLPSSSPSAP